jgi:hypothetical protein
MALAIRQVQTEGRPVANAARYHAQFQFLGRLEAPLAELQGEELRRWLAEHPDGYVVVYLRGKPDLNAIPARHKQPYRGHAVVLVDAPTATRLLAVQVEP